VQVASKQQASFEIMLGILAVEVKMHPLPALQAAAGR